MARNWTRHQILCALREHGLSAAKVAEQAKIKKSTLYGGMDRPYPKVNSLIAQALGVRKQAIWPQFYGPNDERLGLITSRPAVK